jgi:hypothetical protein
MDEFIAHPLVARAIHEAWLAAQRWRDVQPTASLLAAVSPAFVALMEGRPGFDRGTRLLTGLEREVFLAIDTIGSVRGVRNRIADSYPAADAEEIRLRTGSSTAV